MVLLLIGNAMRKAGAGISVGNTTLKTELEYLVSNLVEQRLVDQGLVHVQDVAKPSKSDIKFVCRAQIIAKKVTPKSLLDTGKSGVSAGEVGIEGTIIENAEEVSQVGVYMSFSAGKNMFYLAKLQRILTHSRLYVWLLGLLGGMSYVLWVAWTLVLPSLQASFLCLVVADIVSEHMPRDLLDWGFTSFRVSVACCWHELHCPVSKRFP